MVLRVQSLASCRPTARDLSRGLSPARISEKPAGIGFLFPYLLLSPSNYHVISTEIKKAAREAQARLQFRSAAGPWSKSKPTYRRWHSILGEGR
jgi:hypothetical protein